MLNNNYCVPDEKKLPNTCVYCFFFMTQVLERRKKMKFTADAALLNCSEQ